MLRAYRYSASAKSARAIVAADLPATLADLPDGDILWIDLAEPTDEEERRVLDQFLDLHPLTKDDILRPRRRPEEGAHLPKVEEFDQYLFAIVNPLPWLVSQPEGLLKTRWKRPQLSAVLTHGVLMTHHADALTCIESVHKHLGQRPELLHRGPDFAFHMILDEMVDEYAPVVERFAGKLSKLETLLFDRPTKDVLTKLLHLKRRVLFLRKTLVLEREVLARLVRAEFDLVTDQEIHYYRNVYDHLVRYTELIESAREMVSDLMQLHLASTSNKLNEVMKTLTMISIMVGVPTLIAGIYGMNFRKWFPELDWEYGYPFSLGLMAASALLSLGWFKWKRWW